MDTSRKHHPGCACHVAALMSACALASSFTVAGEPEAEAEITIRAERPASKVVGRTASGVPIRLYQLSYNVSYADLDLTTETGARELRKRVQQAADSACKDLDKLYPELQPDRACPRVTAENSMAHVNRVIMLAQTREQPTEE